MKILSIFLYLIFAYLTYYHSQKHKSNPYLWSAIGLVFSIFGFIGALIYFRKKPTVDKRPTFRPLGFRSKRVWKMVLSSIIYIAFTFSYVSAIYNQTGLNNALPQDKSTSVSSQNSGSGAGADKVQSDNQPQENTGTGDSSDSESTGSNTVSQGLLKVHFIDVGQGDSILVQQGNSTMLIDAGTNASADSLVDYLKKQGIKRIDYLVLTHPHEDHIGGADNVIKTFDIGTIYMPKISANTVTYRDVISAMNSKSLKPKAPQLGSSFKVGDANCTVLGPVKTVSGDLNTYSIVIKLAFGNNKFLFTGDAQASNEKDMINKGFDLSADVLKVGHHGSHTSTTQAFLDKVNPKYAVISAGKGNDYGHPHEETMTRLKDKGVKVYRTDESGTIVCTSDGKNISFNCSPGDYKSGDDFKTQN